MLFSCDSYKTWASMSPSGREVAGEGHKTDVSFPFSPPDASALLEVVGNIGGRGTEGMSLVSSQDNALSHIHTLLPCLNSVVP